MTRDEFIAVAVAAATAAAGAMYDALLLSQTEHPNNSIRKKRTEAEQRAHNAARRKRQRDALKLRVACDKPATNPATEVRHFEPSRASEPLPLSSSSGRILRIAAASSEREECREESVSHATNPATSPATSIIPDSSVSEPRAAAAACESEKPRAAKAAVTSLEVCKEWNGIANQRRPGCVLHGHEYHRQHFELIAASVNAYDDPRMVLRALLEWVWIAPDGVASRVPYPEPRLVAARVHRDLDSAHRWWVQRQQQEQRRVAT
jgi:hypothetical protein